MSIGKANPRSLLFSVIFLLLSALGCQDLPQGHSEVRVITPKGGDSWVVGESGAAYVAWEGNELSGSLRIELLLNELPVAELVDSVDAQNGEFFGTVPDTVQSGSGYQVLVISNDNPDVYDTSPSIRLLPPANVPELEITRPVASDRWEAGKTNGASIEWTSTALEGSVTLQLNNADTLVALISDTIQVSEQAFLWTVPAALPTGGGYRVSIRSNLDSSLYDESASFRIIKQDTTIHLDLLEPDASTRWTVNAPDGATVRWDAYGIPGTVTLQLYHDNEPLTTIAESVDVDATVYTWTVPMSIPADNGYQVYIVSDDNPALNDMSNRFRIDPYQNPATLEVTAPSHGDRWKAGETDGATIQWNSSNLTGTLHLDLYRDDEFLMPIAVAVPVSDGERIWTAPEYLEAGNGYQVYAESDSDSTVSSFSVKFRMEEADVPISLDVTSPGPGDRWEVLAENAALIEWTSENLEGTVHIDLYQNGEKVTDIAQGIPVSEGAYSWTVPVEVPPGSKYQVYLESDEQPLVNGFSREFRIEAAPESPTLEITDPGSGTRWTAGEPNGAVVRWSATNLPGMVKIELHQNGMYLLTIADSVDVESGEFVWTAPLDLTDGRGYQVYVESTTYPLVNALSREFRIEAAPESPTLEITDPGSGTRWTAGEPDGAVVRWNSTNLTGMVKIELHQNGMYLLTMTESVDVESGEFVWTAPLDLTDGRGYQVYVESTTYPLVNALSREFRIDVPSEVFDLSVTSPVEGDTLIQGGDPCTVRWSTLNLNGTLHIELYDKNRHVMVIAQQVPVSDSSYVWTLPSNLSDGDQYHLYLESDDHPDVQTISGDFTVLTPAPPSLELTEPSNGTKWTVGETNGARVAWVAENLEGLLKIELWHRGEFLLTIHSGIDVEEGQFDWTVPEDISVTGSQFSVYLESLEHPEIYIESGNLQIR